MPDQQGTSKTMPFFISLISHLAVMYFGATDTVINPSYAEPLWNGAIQLPYVGSYIQQYMTSQILLGVVSFVFVWMVAMAALGWLGKFFGGLGPVIMLGIGFLIAAVMLGVPIMQNLQNLLPKS